MLAQVIALELLSPLGLFEALGLEAFDLEIQA
jgi:hypothetical protein